MNMQRGPGENMAAFELRIMQAVQRAYAEFPADAREALAKEQFMRGIGYSELQLHLLTQQPADLRAAVQAAEQFEQVRRVAFQNNPSVIRQVTEEAVENKSRDRDEFRGLQDQMKKLAEQVERLVLRDAQGGDNPRGRARERGEGRGQHDGEKKVHFRSSSKEKRGVCFNGGRPGHWQADDCPDPDRFDDAEPSQQANGGQPRGGNGKFYCYYCGRPGHYSKDCRIKMRNENG
jgi:soluble cytochrome b562